MAEACQLVVDTQSAEQTKALGARLGACLGPGDVVALSGELGVGKTALTQGVARGMGINTAVTSPTFTLINEYRAPDGRVLQHVDCFRLDNAPQEMWDIGLDDLLAGENILVIEWAERIAALLPDERLDVCLTHLTPDLLPLWETRQRVGAPKGEDPLHAARLGPATGQDESEWRRLCFAAKSPRYATLVGHLKRALVS